MANPHPRAPEPGMNESIRQKLETLPTSPGCYLFKEKGRVIYVGKAVNLSNRVRSYFHSQAHSLKVAAMLAHTDDFDVLLCSSNLEALTLECNLIKLHRPYYNILLKDDKHYPYMRIDLKEPFPRLTITRRVANDGARYFGPYIGTNAIRQVTELLRRVFPLRTCSLKLPPDRPIRPCVSYEIGQCLAPCAGLCTQEEYARVVAELLAFLRGRTRPVITRLKAEMDAAAAVFQFERAAEIRDCIRDIEGLMEKQHAIQVSTVDQDVIALAQEGPDALAQVLYIRRGRMIGGEGFSLPGEGQEPAAEVLAAFLAQYYEDRPPPREVLTEPVNGAPELEAWLRQRKGGAVRLHSPQRGNKHELLLMARKNAVDNLKKRHVRIKAEQERSLLASEQLAVALKLQAVPRRIEGFDISNTQGAQSVASMVVFVDGKPSRKDYRHFRIRTVEGADDFASMYEAVNRRFLRSAPSHGEEAWPLPDLVLVDGGPEQLRFAGAAMAEAGAAVPIFGLAKRMEEIWLPGQSEPLLLDRHSPALHLVQRVRDEAHRFAITRHRKLRGKASIRSILEDVPGIGPARRRALLATFRTLRAVGEASVEELAAVRGMTRSSAEALHGALHPQATQPLERS